MTIFANLRYLLTGDLMSELSDLQDAVATLTAKDADLKTSVASAVAGLHTLAEKLAAAAAIPAIDPAALVALAAEVKAVADDLGADKAALDAAVPVEPAA